MKNHLSLLKKSNKIHNRGRWINMMNLIVLVISVVVGIGFVKLVNSIDDDFKGYYKNNR